MQAPATSETVQTIDCPVNLRKDSVRLEKRPNLVLECSLDVQMESVLRVKVMRDGKLVYHRRPISSSV